MNDTYSKNNININLIVFIQILLKNKLLFIQITIAFIILGVLMSFILPKKYTVTSILVPQIGASSKANQLTTLAEFAGINLNAFDNSNILSPTTYPLILKSIPFQYELIHSKININEDIKDSITLYEYFTLKQNYKLTHKLFFFILKDKHENEKKVLKENYFLITKKEEQIINKINDCINLSINEKEGYMKLQVTFNNPHLSAQVALNCINLLQKYVTKYKIEKIYQQYLFIQSRFNEKKKEFEKIHNELAIFRDRNKSITTSIAKMQEEELMNKYNISYNVYMELAKQLEQVQLKIKEDTPILTIIEPVKVPIKKSSPNRVLIIASFFFFGLIGGILSILIKEYILMEL